MKVLHRKRRAPPLERVRERAARFAALAARFERPSMLRWVRRYPQLLDHAVASLQGGIEGTLRLLSPAYMLPDGVFGALDKCPQLATRTATRQKLLALEAQLGCPKRALGAAVAYFPTLLTMSEARLAELPATVRGAFAAWPRGRFTDLLARRAAELEAAGGLVRARQPRGDAGAGGAGGGSGGGGSGDGGDAGEPAAVAQAPAGPDESTEEAAGAGDSAEAPSAPDAQQQPSPSAAGALVAAPPPPELPPGPLSQERAAALAAAFLLAQPQMLIKPPDAVRRRLALLDAWLEGGG